MTKHPLPEPHAGHRERIRARYAATGGEGFQDHEFLELLLTYAIPRRDTNLLAHRLLERFGSLSQVFLAEVDQLKSVEGVGQSAAVFLKMQGDLVTRLSLASLADTRGRIKLNTPLAAAKYALARLRAYPYETILVACLNSRLEVIHSSALQRGSLTEAPIYPRVIAETALLQHAHSILLIHNHPSGNPAPSQEDAEATETVRVSLAGIGVRLNDHLIVGGALVYSFSTNVCIDLRADPPQALPLEQFSANGVPSPSSSALKKVMERPFDAEIDI